ncbi:MAG TPA: excinuclease ABC subunit UvrC [Gemmatimonadaceae bacterium]|nr:excinuclease ABC subunit UvrC [Gemmatimonadaceae bacterium]
MPIIEAPERVASKISHLPESPGVYLWKDAGGEVLYVGKAKRLRSRVRSYFASDHATSLKTRALVQRVADLETIVVPSEAHALILEANLIKEHRPRFNIALRDDKSYPYIKVTVQEPFPRLIVTRRLENDGARYFGPYTDVGAMRHALRVVKRVFTVRSCDYDMPREMPERACLDYHIGRCKAPCILAQSEASYRQMIDEVVLFLEGRTGELTHRIRERMEEAAARLDFEGAAELRDVLAHLEQMQSPTVVMEVGGSDRDVVGYARDGDEACVTVLRVRSGRLLGREHQFLENLDGEEDAAVLAAYLVRAYLPAEEHARELLAPFEFDDRELIEEALPSTKIWVPQRGPRRQLTDLAEQNARHLLEEQRLSEMVATERAADPVYALQRDLGLQTLPRSLVCFDISTAQGTDTVASCIWFENGRPKRGEYRKFRIKTVEGTDDFASMHEVVTRYFTRRLESEKPLPDLVVIDGGKGQLSSARAALEELGLGALQTISLAKREEEIYFPGRSEPLRLSRRSAGLRLLQRARDEAHRFAITYNRKRRSMRTVTSELLSIPGIGPKRRRELLHAFGSVRGVREAKEEDIAKLPGFSAAAAKRVLDVLNERNPGSAALAAPPTATADAAAIVDGVAPDGTASGSAPADPAGDHAVDHKPSTLTTDPPE